MSYRRKTDGSIWHWARSCSGWPMHDFRQREDEPSTWGGQTLCDECDSRVRATDSHRHIDLQNDLLPSWVLQRMPSLRIPYAACG